MALFIHLSTHFLLSLIIGVVLSFYFGSPFYMILSAILAGFLIDVDHLIDYFLTFKKFNLKRFLKSQQFTISNRVIKIFHSWELVILFLIISYLFLYNPLIQGIFISASLSMFIHLLSDCIINREPIIFYFLLYRYKNNFLIDNIENKEAILEKK